MLLIVSSSRVKVSRASRKEPLSSVDGSSSSQSVGGRLERVSGRRENVAGTSDNVTFSRGRVTGCRLRVSPTSKPVASTFGSDTGCRGNVTVTSVLETVRRVNDSFPRRTVTVRRVDETFARVDDTFRRRRATSPRATVSLRPPGPLLFSYPWVLGRRHLRTRRTRETPPCACRSAHPRDREECLTRTSGSSRPMPTPSSSSAKFQQLVGSMHLLLQPSFKPRASTWSPPQLRLGASGCNRIRLRSLGLSLRSCGSSGGGSGSRRGMVARRIAHHGASAGHRSDPRAPGRGLRARRRRSSRMATAS